MKKLAKMKVTGFILFFIFVLPSAIFGQSSDTINKCKKDLLSKDEKIRQRAVLVLGKYNEFQSTSLLLKHLKDESKLVRRSALISLQDRIQRKLLAGSRVTQILDLLSDKDVEVRRTAATLTKDFYGNLVSQRGMTRHTNYRTPSTNQQDTSIHEQKFLNAFKDKDEIVRLNVLTTLAYNRRLIFKKKYADIIQKLITDSNTAVVILALNLMSSMPILNTQEVVKKVIIHKDPDVLIGTIKFISAKRLNNKKFLKTLINNKELSVKTAALKCAIELGQLEYQQTVISFMLDEANPVNLRLDLISIANLLGSQKATLILKLMDDKTSSIRVAAINKAVLLIPEKELKAKLFEKLKDSSSTVQNTCLRIIMMRLTRRDSKIIAKIFDNDNVEIRKSIFKKHMQLKIFNEELLQEAMIDDNLDVRLMAFNYVRNFLKSSKTLRAMVIRSLEDSEERIRLQALRSLVHSSDANQMLELFQNNMKLANDQLKMFMVNRLRNMTDAKSLKLLYTIAKTKNAKLKVSTLLAIYHRDKGKVLVELAKMLGDKNITGQQKYVIYMTIKGKGETVSQYFALLLDEPFQSMRVEVIKFFIQNPKLYKESYYNYNLKETYNLISQKGNQLYLTNKFHSNEMIEKMLAKKSASFHVTAYLAISNNYNKTFNKIITDRITSNDIDVIIWALELIHKHKINANKELLKIASQKRKDSINDLLNATNRNQVYRATQLIQRNQLKEFDTEIIKILKTKSVSNASIYLLLSLLELETKDGNEFLKTIDQKHRLNRFLIQSKKYKIILDKRKSTK